VGPDDTDLVVKRLKDAYGFEMPDACAKYLANIHSTIGEAQISPGKRNNNVWSPTSNGVSGRKVLGRDLQAQSGQVVKHALRGKRANAHSFIQCVALFCYRSRSLLLPLVGPF
jgi:hypothetical protein